jgi:signal transduction histidine kinase
MRRQSRVLLLVASAAVLAVMVVFAVELVESQGKARRDVENRFRDRAKVTSALTESLFSSTATTSQVENARRYGGPHVSSAALARQAKQSRLHYLLVLDARGRILAPSPGTSPAAERAIGARPAYVRDALAGQPFALSNVQKPGRPDASLGYAQPFQTRFGRRVAVSGFGADLIYRFVGGYLAQVPKVKGGRAYVVDQHGAVIGSPDKDLRPGEIIHEPGLLSTVAKRDHGSVGGDYFASSVVKGSPWQVVVVASKGELFASVSGARKWVPWILFVAFGLAAAVALALIARVVRGAAELSRANARLGVANETLERRAHELARSNEELERFASIASHDLQEPLRKVQTFAEQLKRKEGTQLSDSGRDYVDRMGAAAVRMQELIQDLLAFSRITTRVRPVEAVDLTEIAREAIADLDAVIEETHAAVEVGELPTVAADPPQMRQLLQNLLSNALKFRREGVRPTVRIEGHARTGVAEITVADNGIGFEPRYSARIFRVFERLNGRNEYPGTGIGLALCRRIAERHGGGITAAATPGKGATFTVTLPLQPADEPPIGAAPSEAGEEVPLVHA